MEYNVNKSIIMSEFDAEFKAKWFNYNEKSVRHHIDTLYYTATVKYDENDTKDPGMQAMLSELYELKQRKRASYSEQIDFCGLSLEAQSFSVYDYCLREPEAFDIYIAAYLPNKYNPRFCVQLRSRSLVLDGVIEAINKSFRKLQELCNEYGLEISEVKENRIDYAFHTNLIQNPMKYFSDDKMQKNLKSSLRLWNKIGKTGTKMTLETLTLGKRSSNNIFFRCYDKTREVIEKNYKSFFLDRWRENGLISEYDYYVYMKAYEMKAFRSGVLIGRLEWYLEYGTNEEIKEKLRDVRNKYYIKSDNSKQLNKELDEVRAEEGEKEIKGFLPPVTMVMNVEFQTKRKFYSSIDGQISELMNKNNCTQKLDRLYVIVYLRAAVLEYLTSTKGVSFVKNRDAKKIEYCDWWKRIRSCKLDADEIKEKAILRVHERRLDLEKAKSRILNALASYSIISGESEEEQFIKDAYKAIDDLCDVNDNDVYGTGVDEETGVTKRALPRVSMKNYHLIKTRKKRQTKNIYEETQRHIEILKLDRQDKLKNISNL